MGLRLIRQQFSTSVKESAAPLKYKRVTDANCCRCVQVCVICRQAAQSCGLLLIPNRSPNPPRLGRQRHLGPGYMIQHFSLRGRACLAGAVRSHVERLFFDAQFSETKACSGSKAYFHTAALISLSSGSFLVCLALCGGAEPRATKNYRKPHDTNLDPRGVGGQC